MADKKLDEPVATGSTYHLESSELARLMALARTGDRDAAFRVHQYYEFSTQMDLESNNWLLRAAELNQPVALYNLVHKFVEKNESEKALYWAKKAKENGSHSVDELLKNFAEKYPDKSIDPAQ